MRQATASENIENIVIHSGLFPLLKTVKEVSLPIWEELKRECHDH